MASRLVGPFASVTRQPPLGPAALGNMKVMNCPEIGGSPVGHEVRAQWKNVRQVTHDTLRLYWDCVGKIFFRFVQGAIRLGAHLRVRNGILRESQRRFGSMSDRRFFNKWVKHHLWRSEPCLMGEFFNLLEHLSRRAMHMKLRHRRSGKMLGDSVYMYQAWVEQGWAVPVSGGELSEAGADRNDAIHRRIAQGSRGATVPRNTDNASKLTMVGTNQALAKWRGDYNCV